MRTRQEVWAGQEWQLCMDEPRMPDPQAEVRLVKEIFAALADIVQPIDIELDLSWTEPGLAESEDYFTRPPQFQRRLREETPPAHVSHLGDQGWVLKRVPRLDPDTIADWLTEATVQVVEDRVVHIGAPRMTCCRARLLAPELMEADVLEVFSDSFVYAVPIEARSDGRWVSGPMGTLTDRPLRIQFYSDNGSIEFQVEACWTPWARPGTLERVALEQSLDRVAALVWRGPGDSTRPWDSRENP